MILLLQLLHLYDFLIRELHDKLLSDVRGDEHSPGEFRRMQNFIGQQGQSPEDARFAVF